MMKLGFDIELILSYSYILMTPFHALRSIDAANLSLCLAMYKWHSD